MGAIKYGAVMAIRAIIFPFELIGRILLVGGRVMFSARWRAYYERQYAARPIKK